MKFVLSFCLLFSTSVFAQKSIGRDAFMVNVRPVLNGIIGDFYQMVSLFPDFPKDLVPLVETAEGLTIDKENLRTSCPRSIDKKCKEQIENIRQKLQKMKSQSMTLLANQKVSEALHINTLAGQRLIAEFDVELEEVKGELDNSSFFMAAVIPQKKETFAVLKELDELNTLLSLAVVEFIPFMYKEDFRHFFFNFVNPIQQQISKNNNHEYVNRNITSLNFAINLLNMTLTKKKKTPEGMGPYLSTMHNRWNSILRYYF